MGTPCLPRSLVLSHAGLQVRTRRPRRTRGRLLKATGWPRPPTPLFLSLSALLCFILSFFLRSPSRCCFLLSVFLFTGRLNHCRSCNLPPRSEHLAHHLDENTLGLKKLLRSVIYCLFDLDPCIFFILGFEIEIYSWFLFPFCFVDG